MQINLSKIKIYTILLSLFYIFGLIGVYYSAKILFAVLITLTLVLLIYFDKLSLKKSLILFFIFIFGIIRADYSLNIDSTLKDITSNSAILKGQIVSSKDISIKNRKVKFYLNVKEADFLDGAKDIRDFENLNSKVLVSLNLNNKIENDIKIGDYISIKGKFTIPNLSTNPHQFNYKKYLFNNDCYNVLYGDSESYQIISSPKFSYKNLNDSWYFILKKFEDIRNKIIEKHSANIKSPRLEILGGIVFGDETINPDEKIKENFKNSGLLHLLAASGLNVALIFGIWWWIAGIIKLPFNFSILSGAIFVILYTFMTGFPPSILRAGIMLIFVLFGKLIDRNVSSVALIFFAGFLILIFSPKMLFDIGFQLSFAVTLGLIVCCPVILSKFSDADKNYKEKFKDKSGFKRYFCYIFTPTNLISVVIVPLVAQLWVIPLQMHYFNNLAPFSVLANIAVVPFIGILSFIGFMGSIFALVPKLSSFIVLGFDFVANPLLGLLIKISEFFGSFKFSIVTTFGMNTIQMFCFWLILLLLTLNIKNNFKIKKEIIWLTVAIIIFLISFLKADCFIKNVKVSNFDMGKDSCIMIKSPKNKYVIYNLPSSNSGFSKIETILNKYLQNERINKIDFTVLPKDTLTFDSAENNKEILAEKDFKIITYLNGNSLLLKYKDKNMLFMDKYNPKSFKKIEKYLPENIDILKMPKNEVDSYLIEKINPKYVIVSDNLSPKTLNMLYEKDIKILQTKDYGFIEVILDNRKTEFYNYDKNNSKLIKIKFYNRIDFAKSSYIKKFLETNQ